MRAIELAGIGFNNLLAYMALLGLLKALDASRPEWQARVSWTGTAANIHVPTEVCSGDVASAAVDGMQLVGAGMDFGEFRNLKLPPSDFRMVQAGSPHIAAALGSDGAIAKEKNKEGYVEYPPLCFMLGSGHQNFLERLKEATAIKNDIRGTVVEHVSASLFDRWRYGVVGADGKKKSGSGSKGAGAAYNPPTFRWDPREYRSHAYRGMDPSKDRIQSVHGAQHLAAVGFTCFFCAPVRGKLGVVACNKDAIVWPIWKTRLSLSAVLVLMGHPHMRMLLDGKTDGGDYAEAKRDLLLMGVDRVMKAKIFWNGKYYRNATPAWRVL